MRSILPILWTDDLFSPACELWEEARSFGLHYGLAGPDSTLGHVAMRDAEINAGSECAFIKPRDSRASLDC